MLARGPNDSERSELLALLDNQRGRLENGELDAEKLAFGEQGSEPDLDDGNTVELAAWTAVSRVLLNLDEAITRE